TNYRLLRRPAYGYGDRERGWRGGYGGEYPRARDNRSGFRRDPESDFSSDYGYGQRQFSGRSDRAGDLRRARRDWDEDRYGREEERGFWDRAGDEVASWFGDDDAER